MRVSMVLSPNWPYSFTPAASVTPPGEHGSLSAGGYESRFGVLWPTIASCPSREQGPSGCAAHAADDRPFENERGTYAKSACGPAPQSGRMHTPAQHPPTPAERHSGLRDATRVPFACHLDEHLAARHLNWDMRICNVNTSNAQLAVLVIACTMEVKQGGDGWGGIFLRGVGGGRQCFQSKMECSTS